jgi:hypothetical protein
VRRLTGSRRAVQAAKSRQLKGARSLVLGGLMCAGFVLRVGLTARLTVPRVLEVHHPFLCCSRSLVCVCVCVCVLAFTALPTRHRTRATRVRAGIGVAAALFHCCVCACVRDASACRYWGRCCPFSAPAGRQSSSRRQAVSLKAPSQSRAGASHAPSISCYLSTPWSRRHHRAA